MEMVFETEYEKVCSYKKSGSRLTVTSGALLKSMTVYYTNTCYIQ